jgi:hypothetical protein
MVQKAISEKNFHQVRQRAAPKVTGDKEKALHIIILMCKRRSL